MFNDTYWLAFKMFLVLEILIGYVPAKCHETFLFSGRQ
jgi:hypothetical protein